MLHNGRKYCQKSKWSYLGITLQCKLCVHKTVKVKVHDDNYSLLFYNVFYSSFCFCNNLCDAFILNEVSKRAAQSIVYVDMGDVKHWLKFK